MNIYVQDDLAEKVKALRRGLNVSGVCQDALRAELHRRTSVAALRDGMERVELYLEEAGDVAFVGRLVGVDEGPALWVYYTRRGRLAVYDGARQGLQQFDEFHEFAAAHEGLPDLVADVAAALGEKHVTELDI